MRTYCLQVLLSKTKQTASLLDPCGLYKNESKKYHYSQNQYNEELITENVIISSFIRGVKDHPWPLRNPDVSWQNYNIICQRFKQKAELKDTITQKVNK